MRLGVACIARRRVARFVTLPEPAHALLGGAVRELCGWNTSAGEAIVADFVGGVHCLVDVTILEKALLEFSLGPRAGKAIGLELDPHGGGIGLLLRHGLP